MVKFTLKKKTTGELIASKENTYYYPLMLGLDGKVYEVSAASSYGDSWLETEDVSEEYEIIIIKD